MLSQDWSCGAVVPRDRALAGLKRLWIGQRRLSGGIGRCTHLTAEVRKTRQKKKEEIANFIDR